MNTSITWYRHNHENRNDLLRFSLMRLHFNGEIEYRERGIDEVVKDGFDSSVLAYPDLRHLSFLIIKKNKEKIRCIVDNEDSFALVSPLLKTADIYFCAGYNSDIFKKKQFVKAYSWQNEDDLRWYKNTIEGKINELGDHFPKVKKFIPIAPNLTYNIPVPGWKVKLGNLEHKWNKKMGKSFRFSNVYKGFEIRQNALEQLRGQQLKFDVVLNDSLWGWPQHRINLHKELSRLAANGYQIHSSLKWTEGVQEDGSFLKNIDKAGFPMVTQALTGNYELMLSQSRLAVFACGFHWGWRNIMMFALMMGTPVLTDRLLTEAYFDINEFKISQIEDHSWSGIESHLNNISEEQWHTIRIHNQQVYDKYMRPEKVGSYFLNTVSDV